jgi:hypothetical protein
MLKITITNYEITNYESPKDLNVDNPVCSAAKCGDEIIWQSKVRSTKDI